MQASDKRTDLRSSESASIRKAAASAALTATTSPADSRSNSERGSPDPGQQQVQGASPAAPTAIEAADSPASEIRGMFDMNDSANSGTAIAMDIGVDDPDESFDMLANMPPTPGGGLVAPSGDGEGNDDDNDDAQESLTDMLGIPGSSPTTPAAVAAQQGGVDGFGNGNGSVRRSPRLAASGGRGTGTGGRASWGVVPGSGGVNGRRGVGVGAGRGVGGASGGGGMKTPYSSRRSGRRPGGQALTPGTAASNVDGDDANASFMTAIMGSVDGSTGDSASVLRRANLFSADSEPTTPVNVGEEEDEDEEAPASQVQQLPATPSFDVALASVEKRVAAVKLTGEDSSAASLGAEAADATASCANGDWEDIAVCPGGAGAGAGAGADGVKEIPSVLDEPTPSPAAEGTSAAAAAAAAPAAGNTDDGEPADQAKQWLEPLSPAVAPLSSSSKRAAGRSTFSATPKESTTAEVSPYGARGGNGGGLSTSSTFGISSDDEGDVMAAAFAGGGGGGAVAEMMLPKLARVEESLPAQPSASPAAPVAAVVADVDDDEAVSDFRDVAGGNSTAAAAAAVDAGSSVILDDMLQNAAGLKAGGKLGVAGPRAGAGPEAPSSAADAVPGAILGGEGKSKGSTTVLSAVEKEAMALAAACVAEQEAITKAPEAENAVVEAIAGAEQEAPVAAAAAAASAEVEGAKEEPEVTGEENGDGACAGEALSSTKGMAGTPGKGRRPATPGKSVAATAGAANSNSEKKPGGDLKTSSVSISRVALPAAVSARRGSTSGGGSRRNSVGTRPESPAARSGVVSRSPPPSGLRRPSPSPSRRSSGLRPPSPSTAPRRQSMAFGSRVPASGATSAAATVPKKLETAEPVDDKAAAAPGAVATATAKRATSRGRDRGARERASVGGFGFGRGRDVSTSTGGAVAAAVAAAPAPAAPVVVAALDPSSRLLAATKVSQGRARPRSASPAVSSARGRASTGGFGGPGGPGAGANRRVSTAGPTPLQQQQQRQQRQQQRQEPQARPRSASTGRRALTMPKTPNLRTSTRYKPGKAHESTEETEFRQQQAMQKQLTQAIRKNQAGMEAASRAAYSGNVRSTKPLTVPESPAMKTVGRLGGKVYAAVGPQDQAGFSPTHPAKNDPLSQDSLAQLAAQPKGPTVPEPFHLSKSNRVSREGEGPLPGTPRSKEETLTFCESLARIENKTPDRFRTRPAGEQPKPAPAPRVDPKPTLPQSPRFRTEARAAGHSKTHILSREEREEAELAEMKKHQFKARPYSADGFGVSGEQGVFRPQHSDKKLTQPAPFRLSSDGRASKRAPSPHRSRDEEELSKQFKARPMPGGRSSSVGRVRPGAKVGAELKPLTVAASPTFSTKRRSALRSNSLGGAEMKTSEEAELEKAAANKFRARPMPDYSKLAQCARRRSSAVAPTEPPPSLTEPKPFQLLSDRRGKAKQALLKQREENRRRQEEAAARVRARPLPAPSHGFCPQPSDRPLTEPSEFTLSSQARHEKAEREFLERVRQEEERARRATEVIALPLPAATFEPELYPERTEVSLTQPVEVVMHSSARAEGRAKWDEENQTRLAEAEHQRREQAEATAAAEKRAITELRRRSLADGGMCFKAKPIKWNNAPPEVAQLSTAPLTTPITPNLRTKRRAMNAPRDPAAPIS